MRHCIIIILFLLAPVFAQAGQTLSFGYIDQPLSSMSLAVLKAAYEKLGYTIETAKGPAARILADSNAGLSDGEVHRIAAISSQYPNLIRIDVPINTVEGMLISCGKTYDLKNIKDLEKYRVAVRIGNIYATNLTKDLPNVTRTTSADKLLQLLLEGRVDLLLSDRPWAISQKGLPGNECLRIQEPPLVTIPLYHYIHKRHRALVPAITRVLKKMQNSGESETIRRQAIKEFIARLQYLRTRSMVQTTD